MHLNEHENDKPSSRVEKYLKEFTNWIQANEEIDDVSFESGFIKDIRSKISVSKANVSHMLNSLKIDEDAEYSNYLKRKSKLKFWKESNCPSVQINQEFPANDSEPQLRESFFLDKELKGEYAKLHKRVGKDYNRRKIGKLFEKDFEDSDMSIDYDLMPYPGWNKSELKKISEILKSSDSLSELKENLKSTKGLEINKTKIKLKDDLKAILRMIRDLDI